MRLFHLAISFFLVLTLAFQSFTNETETKTTNTENSEKDASALLINEIIPAFEDMSVKAQTVTVKGTKAQTLELPSGSSIEVPESAFVDADGNPVEGNVDIEFTEFHNAAEILTGGIPMEVIDPNGEKAFMKTAGMYEINGYQNGKPVFVAEGKALTVNLLSEVDGDYDFWVFDRQKGNWDNLGTNTATPNEAGQNAIAAANELRRKIGPAPTPPAAFNKNTPPIDIQVNLQKFPELKGKQGIVWQYAGKDKTQDPANNPAIFETNWDDIELTANDNEDTYTLTLSNGREQLTLPVAPTLQGKDLEQAKADYQKQLAAYRKKMAKAEAQADFANQQRAFVRSFQVSGFGIYNYDILTKRPAAIPVMANFEFGQELPEKILKKMSVFLIAEGGRMVVKYPRYDWEKFRIEPNSDAYLVAVLPGNKLATLSNEALQQQMPEIKEARNKRYTFKLTVQEEPVRSVEEVQEQLVAL